ncbi:Uncharacterised protein [Roseburia hominis]|nr:Uncharacterised protein [Roseburia hominis]
MMVQHMAQEQLILVEHQELLQYQQVKLLVFQYLVQWHILLFSHLTLNMMHLKRMPKSIQIHVFS